MRGVWHHHDRRRRGPRELTGIADLTRGKEHPTARLLDLVPGRSGTVYKNGGPSAEKTSAREYESRHWTPSRDSKNAIALACSKDATSVPGAFHIVTLAGDAPGEVRRRVQQDTTGHRGRTG